MLNLGVLSFLLVVRCAPRASLGGRLADVGATRNRLELLPLRRAAPGLAHRCLRRHRELTTAHDAAAAPPPRIPRCSARRTLSAPPWQPCGFAYVAQYVRRSWRHAQNGPHVAGARFRARHGGGDAKGYCRAPGRARARRGAHARRAVAHGGLGVCVYTHRAPRVMSLRKVSSMFFTFPWRRRRHARSPRPGSFENRLDEARRRFGRSP